MPDLLPQLGTELVGGADVILGALLGGGSAVVAGYFADKRRFEREDQYRDHAERREAYARFLAAWDRIYGGGDHSGEARRELSQTWMTVRLITQSDKVRRLSDDLFGNVGVYVNTDDATMRAQLKSQHARLVPDLIEAAREDLDKPKLRRVSGW